MDCSVPEKVPPSGMPAAELKEALERIPHRVQRYEKGETIFRLMEPALRIGVILEGRAEAQKIFPNGSQVKVSAKGPGDMIGAAAAFSRIRRYPCSIVSLGPSTVMMVQRDDLLGLLQKDARMLEHFITQISTAAYMLQQRLELFSYSGIAQKAACWILMQARQTGKATVCVPGSVSNWAMMLNVSRPSLHRELTRLERSGIISCDPPAITILNEGALQNVLSR